MPSENERISYLHNDHRITTANVSCANDCGDIYKRPYRKTQENFIFSNFNPSLVEEDDSDTDVTQSINFSDNEVGHFITQRSKTGKKTKGRVKIKMEFIDNKLRRYTTFSKRKTGIMKKVCFSLDFSMQILLQRALTNLVLCCMKININRVRVCEKNKKSSLHNNNGYF